MPGRVFVTGGSGFVGQAVITALLERNWQVSALVRKGATFGANAAWPEAVRLVHGDLLDPGPLESGIFQADAVVHLVGIIAEKPSRGVTFERVHVQGTRNVVDVAKRAGVARYVQMSALGARADAASKYHQTKFAAEQIVRESHLDATIFRPSLIHGPQGEFMKMEAAWARGKAPPYFYMPYFGGGLFGTKPAGMLQPVYVKDVGRAFAEALDNPAASGATFEIGGKDQLTWPKMHRICATEITGKIRPVAAIPAWAALSVARVVPNGILPFNRDQVLMSQEPNTCDLEQFVSAFGWEPMGFLPALQEYAGQM